MTAEPTPPVVRRLPLQPPRGAKRFMLSVDVPADTDPELLERLIAMTTEYGNLIRASAPRAATRISIAPDPVAPAGGGEHPGPIARPVALRDELRIDASLREVRIKHELVALAYKEFEILAYLAANPGRVISRAELINVVWEDGTSRPSPRTIDVHVRRIRAKLGRHQRCITTVRGSGYRFDPNQFVRSRGPVHRI